MLTVKQVKDAMNYSVDTVGKNKAGQIVLRRGYFYSNGQSADSFCNQVFNSLKQAGLSFRVVDSGDVWKAFKGGASTANQSHFFVIVE